MYDNISYDLILKRMLDRVPSGFDKREGSIIYDALAPAAMELMGMYIELNIILRETFGDTASRDFLIRRAKERGLTPQPATQAILKAISKPSTLDIKLGSRLSLEELNYEIIEKIQDGEYKVRCETLGVLGNKYFGFAIPIDYIQGLESVEITELLIPGEDEEDTEVFRKRYFDSFDSKAYGGNVEDYLRKTNSIPGVGCTKVTPVWDGGGTVKLTILDANFDRANDTLIEYVQDIIDPTMDATGIGIAPIGHIVTVDTAEEVAVNVSSVIVCDTGYTFGSLKSKLMTVLEEYLLEIRKSWADQNNHVVRIAQIESRILAVEGIVDITNTKINRVENNLTLDKYQIPIIGDITNEGN